MLLVPQQLPLSHANTILVVIDVHELKASTAFSHFCNLFSCPTTSISMTTKVSSSKVINGFEIRKSNQFPWQNERSFNAHGYHNWRWVLYNISWSLLVKEQGSDVFRWHKPSHTGSLLSAHIRYEETYGVTAIFKYNNDCDNASGSEFAFCYAREKRIQNSQWTPGTITNTSFISPRGKKAAGEKKSKINPLLELICTEKQLSDFHKNL